jgi:hypothetical protein
LSFDDAATNVYADGAGYDGDGEYDGDDDAAADAVGTEADTLPYPRRCEQARQ